MLRICCILLPPTPPVHLHWQLLGWIIAKLNIVLLITNKLQLKSSSLKSLSLFSRLSGKSSKCSFFHVLRKHSIIKFSWFIIPTFGVEWKNVQTFHFLTFWGRNKIQGLHGLYFSWTVACPSLHFQAGILILGGVAYVWRQPASGDKSWCWFLSRLQMSCAFRPLTAFKKKLPFVIE